MQYKSNYFFDSDKKIEDVIHNILSEKKKKQIKNDL